MPVDPSLAAFDAAAPEPEQDTPEIEVEPAAPVEDTPPATEAPSIDFEKRYNDLRSEFDRRAQREAERDRQLDEYRQQLESLQASTPAAPKQDNWDDEEYEVDPLARQAAQEAQARVARLEAQLAAQAEQDTLARQEAQEHTYIDEELDRLEQQFDTKLPDRASAWIGRDALENRDPITGQPDVEGAFAAYNQMMEAQKKQWVSGKRSAPAPASGPGAVEVPDLDDPDARQAWIDRQLGY